MTIRDTALRSAAKGVSYRLCGTAATIVIAYVFTKDVVISLSVGGADLILKILLYYAHERVWERIPWGRRKQ